MKDLTVLLTGAGAPGAKGIIWALKNNNEREIRIIGTDMREEVGCIQGLSAFFKIPPVGHAEYLETLHNICQKESVDILQPINTIELNILARNKANFAKHHTLICVMDEDVLDIANNKIALLQRMKNAGLPTPEFRVIHTVNDFLDAAREIGYPQRPICIKRPDGNGSRGMRFIDSKKSRTDIYLYEKPGSLYTDFEDMKALLPAALEKTELFVMELLRGEEYSVDSLLDHGNVIVSACRRVDVVVNSINVDSVIVQKQDVIDYCDKISALLKLDGNAGYDIRYNDKGQPMILEINPRLQATVPLTVWGGINLPYLCIKKMLGEPFEIPPLLEGRRIAPRYETIFLDEKGKICVVL